MAVAILTQKELKSLLNYNPQTGIFTNLIRRSQRSHIGAVAGSKNGRGYLHIEIHGKKYKSHRLAWLYIYGQMPKKSIDHINGIKDDNRIANLRECLQRENNQNTISKKHSTSQYLGVCLNKDSKKWRAQISIDGKKIYIGSFTNEYEAYKAYCNEKKKFHTFNPVPRELI